jgi:hypothetical protein
MLSAAQLRERRLAALGGSSPAASSASTAVSRKFYEILLLLKGLVLVHGASYRSQYMYPKAAKRCCRLGVPCTELKVLQCFT